MCTWTHVWHNRDLVVTGQPQVWVLPSTLRQGLFFTIVYTKLAYPWGSGKSPVSAPTPLPHIKVKTLGITDSQYLMVRLTSLYVFSGSKALFSTLHKQHFNHWNISPVFNLISIQCLPLWNLYCLEACGSCTYTYKMKTIYWLEIAESKREWLAQNSLRTLWGSDLTFVYIKWKGNVLIIKRGRGEYITKVFPLYWHWRCWLTKTPLT